MKEKATMKEIKGMYRKVFAVGYCDIQSLTSCRQPLFYTSGVYGWNADVFDNVSSIAIVTGYRPFGIKAPRELCEKYEKMAREILAESGNYEAKRIAVNGLFYKFCDELDEL